MAGNANGLAIISDFGNERIVGLSPVRGQTSSGSPDLFLPPRHQQKYDAAASRVELPMNLRSSTKINC